MSGRHPTILCVAGCRLSRLFVEVLELVDVVVRNRVPPGFGVHAINTGCVETEDLALDVGGERFIAELLHQ